VFRAMDPYGHMHLMSTEKGILNAIHDKCLYTIYFMLDRLCGLVVRVLGYKSGGPGPIPGTTRKKSNGSGMGSTQPREYN
jgi:hypothetical protein